MRRFGIALGLSLCAFYALAAQTNAQPASPAPASAKPLRHLEYSFSVSTLGLENPEFNGVDGGVETATGPGSSYTSNGGNGRMFVDVLSVASDGSLVVRISELVQNEPRPRGVYTCNVYGNTSVVCPSTPAPSQAEWVLLSYLGRQFIDGAPWDASGHWQRKESSNAFETEEDFTLVDAGNGKKVIVREVKQTKLHDGGFGSQKSDVAIHYDRALEVPDVIRDDVETTGDGEGSHATYTFTLTRDSFAKPAR